MKERIQFDYCWDCQHWHLLPAISLNNYEDQLDIHFMFMGFWFEIAFMKW